MCFRRLFLAVAAVIVLVTAPAFAEEPVEIKFSRALDEWLGKVGVNAPVAFAVPGVASPRALLEFSSSHCRTNRQWDTPSPKMKTSTRSGRKLRLTAPGGRGSCRAGTRLTRAAQRELRPPKNRNL